VARINGTWFVSPGAVSRGSLGEDNISRVPAIAVIEFDKTKVLDITLVAIPCRPGEEVLNTSTVLKVVDLEKNLEQFKESIEALRTLGENEDAVLAPEQVLRLMAKAMDCHSPRVLDYCMEKLEELRK